MYEIRAPALSLLGQHHEYSEIVTLSKNYPVSPGQVGTALKTRFLRSDHNPCRRTCREPRWSITLQAAATSLSGREAPW